MPDDKQSKANSEFRKLQRAEDGKKATLEYEADAAATRKKTERLRALRLAHEAEQSAAAAATPPAPKKKKAAKKAKPAAAKLTTWLKDREDSGHST